MKVFLDTVGCRLNQSEIEKMAGQLRTEGHNLVESATEADLIIINTCAVTTAAASDSRQKIRQAAQTRPGKIVVTGCLATLEPEITEKIPGVSRVFINGRKNDLVGDLLKKSKVEFERDPVNRIPLPGVHKRTRAFIKVQDGCANYCTFCITRILRGRPHSVPLKEVLQDIQTARSGGAQEIVLSGVNLGAWGQDSSDTDRLFHLVQAILAETDIPRLRLSSLEPWDLSENFISLWKNPRICQHIHLPLQSGSQMTLKRMGRKTDPDSYAKLVAFVRDVSPNIAITTDIISGFPGETQEEFFISPRHSSSNDPQPGACGNYERT
jgi:threonylcarbamoyladenosine tRNA methylthiotransferase MtaB